MPRWKIILWLTKPPFLLGGIVQLLCWDVSVKSWLFMVFLCVCSVIKDGQAFFPRHGRKKVGSVAFHQKKSHLKPCFFLKITIKSQALPKLVGVSTGSGDPREPTS